MASDPHKTCFRGYRSDQFIYVASLHIWVSYWKIMLSSDIILDREGEASSGRTVSSLSTLLLQ